jgi:hypothetical protein
MSTMNMPGFTAESSICKTEKPYYTVKSRVAKSAEQKILPQLYCSIRADGSQCCCNFAGHCICEGGGSWLI